MYPYTSSGLYSALVQLYCVRVAIKYTMKCVLQDLFHCARIHFIHVAISEAQKNTCEKRKKY